MEEATEILQVVRESESPASRVGTSALVRYQPFDQVPDGRDAGFPLRATTSATTSAGTAATAAALTATFGLAAASWVVAVRQMSGMDMGASTRLGSFAFFVAVWVSMMAAMMLPGAAPAVVRRVQTGGQMRAIPLFVGSYLAVWTLVGVAVYELYRPHGPFAAGAVAITAGLLILVALSVMSVTWMSVIAVLVLTQKIPPAKAAVDVPLALAMRKPLPHDLWPPWMIRAETVRVSGSQLGGGAAWAGSRVRSSWFGRVFGTALVAAPPRW
jgi:hypothetical protein